jgi:tetratricopeptide (TPR) repeat protein
MRKVAVRKGYFPVFKNKELRMKSLFTGLLVGLVLLVVVCPYASGQQDDPVRVIWETYLQTRDGLNDLDEWIDKIIEVVDKHPESQARQNVLRNLVGSCNSAKKYERSISLLEKLLPIEKPARWRLRDIEEFGSVYEEMYREALQRNDKTSAKEYAEQTLKYYAQYQVELQSLKTSNSLSTDDLSYLQEGLVIHFNTESEFLKDVRGDLQASIKKDDEAVRFLQAHPHIKNYGYNEAFFQKRKAEALLELEKREEAESAMIDSGLSAKPEAINARPETIKSLQARKFALTAYPKKGKDYRAFLQRWLDEVPQDAETAVVLRDIGQSFLEEGLYDEAIGVFENIRNNWWEQILILDEIPLKNQLGGYGADVLGMLGQCYQKTTQAEKAAQCIDELKRLVPKDAWIITLERQQGQTERDAERKQAIESIEKQNKNATTYRLIVFSAVNGVLILLLIYFATRKKRSK